MAESLVLSVAGIVILGVVAQWLAWRIRVAPILFFLAIGFLAGPVTGFLEPDALLGDLFSPIVSLGVAVILFEGGLSLRYREVRRTGAIVANLVTVGVIVTWVGSAIAAHWILGLSVPVSLLLGSILTVSGPTVVGPLLRHVRPRGEVGSVLKWEGIVIDPVGALLAILVFDAILVGDPEGVLVATVVSIAQAVFVGGFLGLLGAALLVLALYRHWGPDFLQSAYALILVFAVFVAAEATQSEAGLLAVTVMGVALANQRYVHVDRIAEFKETLRVLIIPALFILLTARLTMGDLVVVGPAGLAFLGVLVLILRPLTVLLASRGSALDWRSRAFAMGLMPRGIVAAAIASVFGIRLADEGVAGANMLVPFVFLVIFGTGILYSLTARPLGRLLGVARTDGGDVLIVGANEVARTIARALRRTGLGVHLIDTNRSNVTQALIEELGAREANALSAYIEDDIDIEPVGYVLVTTPNDQTNMLAAIHLGDYIGRRDTYQLPADIRGDKSRLPAARLAGRVLFGKDWNYRKLRRALQEGWTIKATKITPEFTFADYQATHVKGHVPLFVVHDRRLRPFTIDARPDVFPGAQIVALVHSPGSHPATPLPASATGAATTALVEPEAGAAP